MAQLNADTFKFMTELARNNNREWFTINKTRYQTIRKDFIDFMEGLMPSLEAFDESMKGIDVARSVFRINRDVRFSNDKSPYKTSIAAVFIEGGRKNFSEYAGYYIHLENGGSLVAGGAYNPPTLWITGIREKIKNEAGRFKSIINEPEFVKIFGGLEGEKLKSAPRGYKNDDPEIELLKMKSFMAVRSFTEEEVLSTGFGEMFIESARILKPLNDFVNEAAHE
jgi:uncharacterized protein (TIGR02453 family)